MTPSNTEFLAQGTNFGRYVITRPIGRGGMSAVYEAVHRDLQKRVALKVLHPELARDPASVERFLREGRAAARIHHPHVIEVFDVGVHDRRAFLVMEYLHGEDLASYIDARDPLPVAEIAALLLPVCSAVAAAHDGGVLHRDLKPENIFLSRTPQGTPHPVVLDFGISKFLDGSEATRATMGVVGTPHYISPEQARGVRPLDAQVDQYALGIILYECATKHLPYHDESLFALLQLIAAGGAPPPSHLRPDLPPDFDALVMRAIATDPTQRFPSVRALAHALLAFAPPSVQASWAPAFASAAPQPSPDNTTERDLPPVSPRPSRRALAWGAAGVAAVGLIAAVAVASQRPDATLQSSSHASLAAPVNEPAPLVTDAMPEASAASQQLVVAPEPTESDAQEPTRATRRSGRSESRRHRTRATRTNAAAPTDVTPAPAQPAPTPVQAPASTPTRRYQVD